MTARDDYRTLDAYADDGVDRFGASDEAARALDEIDRLRVQLDRIDDWLTGQGYSGVAAFADRDEFTIERVGESWVARTETPQGTYGFSFGFDPVAAGVDVRAFLLADAKSSAEWREFHSAEYRAALYGLCEVCGAPRASIASQAGIVTLVCANGHVSP